MKIGIITVLCLLVVTDANAATVDGAAMVAAHNKWRAKAGVTEKLRYSSALARSAQAWADTLKRRNHCQQRHSNPRGQYGENLLWASALVWSDGRQQVQRITPEQVVDGWASERVNYDYANNACRPGSVCGHYTQIVWRTTTKVGCAMAVCGDTSEQVWVCQYQPAGNLNWIGRKSY